RHRVEVGPSAGQGVERRVDGGGDRLQVGASRQLGDDATVVGMQRHLRRHHRGEHLTSVTQHRGGGLVAGGLDGEQIQRGYSSFGSAPRPGMSKPLSNRRKFRLKAGAWMLSLHMMIASSPLSV